MDRLEFHIKQVGKKWAVRNMANPDYSYCDSLTKAENKIRREFRKWRDGATDIRIMYEKEDKECQR